MADIDIYKAKLPQDDTNLYRFRDGVIEPLVDTSYEETDYANPLTFETLQAQTAKNTKIKIDPIQDLHGYSKPWVGGAGKNFLPVETTGNVNRGITYALVKDSDNNIISISAKGTVETGYTSVCMIYGKGISSDYSVLAGKTCILSGGVNNSSYIQFWKSGGTVATSKGSDSSTFTFPSEEPSDWNISIINESGTVISGTIYFYPMLRLSTVSDSTFEPYENICPISGHDQIKIDGCGKNLCDLDSVRIGIAWNETHNPDRATILTPILGNTTYTLKVDTPNNMFDANHFFTVQKDANGNVVGTSYSVNNNTAYTFTTEKTTTLFIVQFNKTNVAKTDFANTTVQLEAGSEATEYVPYAGQSNNLSIDLPSTVYGGVLDLESGELVVTHNIVDLGSLTWSKQTKTNSYRFTSTSTIQSKVYDVNTKPNAVCDYYEPLTANNTWDGLIGLSIGGASGSTYFAICDTHYADASEFKTGMNGVKCAYELATPFTLYISPEHLKLLKVQNNLTTSQFTQIKVTYRNGVFATLEELSDTAQDIYDEISGDVTTISGNPINFTTREKQKSKSTIIDIEPIQDLHGFTKPWVGGAGKNKLPLTVDGIKSANTTGTWSGNVYTINSGTIEVFVDSDNNITGVKINGSFNATSVFLLYVKNGNPYPFENTNYSLNGCPVGGSASTFKLDCIYRVSGVDYTLLTDLGVGATTDFSVLSNAAQIQCRIVVYSGTYTNKIFYPMIRLSSVTDATFEPYTNIASISGRSSVDIDGCGKNLLKLNQLTATTINGLTMTPVYSNGKLDYLNFNGTLSATTDFVIGGTFGVKQRFIFLGKGITYTFSRLYKNTGVQLLMRDGTENVITPNTDEYTFTLDKDTEIGSIFFRFNAAKYENIKIYPQLEAGSLASLYEPYTPSTDLTISFGTTVYGGKLDVEKGELVVDRDIVDLDDFTWTYSSAANELRWYSNTFGAKYKTYESSQVPNSVFEEYETTSIQIQNANVNKSNATVYGNRIYIRNLSSTIEPSGNAILELVDSYKTTIQLTPQQIQLLKGINNISTTGTTITVTFKNGSVAHLDDLPENAFTDLDKEKLASIDTLAVTLDLLTHSIVVTQDI